MSRTIMVLCTLGLLCGAANAGIMTWIPINVSNSDFSTAGTLAMGSSVAIPANSGTADNGKLFADWKVLGSTLAGTGYSVVPGEARVYKSAANGKNATPELVHDALKNMDGSYVTVAATQYKLEFDARHAGYAYKAYAALLFGDTNTADSSTWKLGSYFNASRPYQLTEWEIGLTSTYQTLSYTWDNTAGAQVGQHLRMGFLSSQYGTSQSASLYVDNVKVYYWGEVPEPASMSLLAVGALALVRRGKRS